MKNKLFTLILLVTLLFITNAYAQTHQQAQHHNHHTQHGNQHQMNRVMPKQAGQGGFAAIQEIVEILMANPDTDWSKVNIDALREHLVDMNQLTLYAKTSSKLLKNGIEIVVTGEERTLFAIQSMVPAHAAELDKQELWQAKAEVITEGARLRVISTDEYEIKRIHALGFFGLMATGAHHQAHHLGMATGRMVH